MNRSLGLKLCMYLCACVCAYIYVYIYTHIHIYTHIYTYTRIGGTEKLFKTSYLMCQEIAQVFLGGHILHDEMNIQF